MKKRPNLGKPQVTLKPAPKPVTVGERTMMAPVTRKGAIPLDIWHCNVRIPQGQGRALYCDRQGRPEGLTKRFSNK